MGREGCGLSGFMGVGGLGFARVVGFSGLDEGFRVWGREGRGFIRLWEGSRVREGCGVWRFV